MEPAFTLGLLGGCGDGIRTAQYFAQVAAYFQQFSPHVRILMPLTSKGERSVASCLLAQRRENPGLEVYVVLTARQWQDYLKNAPSGKAAACNRIIADADRYEVLPDSTLHLSQPALFRLFVERCDHVIFNEHRAGEQITGDFRELITDMGVPLPVQYGLGCPQYTNTHYPLDRRDYRNYESGYYDTSAELRQSIGYLRRNNFVIHAECLPQVFLRKWLTVPMPGWYRHLTTPDDITGLFRLRETPRHDYLALKVFACAYAVRHDLWATGRETPSGADAIRRFRQFGQLLKIIANRRETGEWIEPFDLFDFGGYDKMLRQNNFGLKDLELSK